MFDLSWSELLVIGVVALLVIGPKELPGTLRTLGQWVARIRRMAGEFQDQFREALREAEVEEMRKKFEEAGEEARKAVASHTNFDPIGSIRKELEGAAATPAQTPPATPAEVAPATQPGAGEPADAGASPPPDAAVDSSINGEALAALAPPTEQDIRSAMETPGGPGNVAESSASSVPVPNDGNASSATSAATPPQDREAAAPSAAQDSRPS